jgi:cytochrome P450
MASHSFLDLTQVPLDEYTKDPYYHKLVYECIENIVNYTLRSTSKRALGKSYETFMAKIIKDNYESISASKTNIFQSLYNMFLNELPPKDKIGTLGEVESNLLKLCFSFLCGLVVNTAHQLTWVISLIETQPDLKEQVIREATTSSVKKMTEYSSISSTFPFIQSTIIETLRFNPLVPMIGKLVKVPHQVEFRGNKIHLAKDTFLIVDLLECNRSKECFPFPHEFNLKNVDQTLLAKGVFPFLNSHTATRSFGGGSNLKSRCPGRFMTLTTQAWIVASLYGTLDIASEDVSMRYQNEFLTQPHAIKEHRGTIHLSRRDGTDADTDQ